jgi:hypothetical protein
MEQKDPNERPGWSKSLWNWLTGENSVSDFHWATRGESNCELIWDEYKHRHDLCWRLVFQLTFAVVIISVVPYIKPSVAQELGSWIVALPIIGIALTVFGLLRLRRELALLSVIRARHRDLQGLSNQDGKTRFRKTRFSLHATLYLFCLIALGFVNLYVILCVWLPKL